MSEHDFETGVKCVLCGGSFWRHWNTALGHRIFHDCVKQYGDSQIRYHYSFSFTGPYRTTVAKAEATIPSRMRRVT